MPFAPTIGAPWTQGSGGVVVSGGGGSSALGTASTVTGTKSASNPTFDFDSIPESVVKVDSTYWCCYQGNWAQPRDVRLASASSITGPWTQYGGNPILTVGSQSWESAIPSVSANAPELYYTGGTFYLVYGAEDANAGTTGSIGIATATTVTGPYTKYSGNPILEPGSGGVWDSRRVTEPSILLQGGTWVMAYMGEDDDVTWGQSEKVGIATAASPTGTWTKAGGNPLIDWGTEGTWDDRLVADPYIFYENSVYWIWYSGGGGSSGEFSRPWKMGLAYATSPTGTWTKLTGSNPIISNGGSGAYDEKGSWRGSVYNDGGNYHVVFGGINNALNAVKGGNATLTIT